MDRTVIALTSPLLAASQPLRLQMLDATSRHEAMSIWQTLEVELPSKRLMCSSLWTETWLRHYGMVVPHQFAVAFRNEQPCGICLLTQGVDDWNGPCRLRTWHVGTAGESEADSVCVEYNSLLVRPQDKDAFQQEVWRWISARHDWNEFRLDGFQIDEMQGWPIAETQSTICVKPSHFHDLTSIRARNVEAISQLGVQTRSVIRQNLRKLGPLQCEWAETTRQAEHIFADQIRLHQIRWNSVGAPGCYASRIFLEFHLDLLNRLIPLGLMGLFRVRNEQGTVGCGQVVIDNGRACIYQGGRVLTDDRRLSTGLTVDYLLIEECRRRGYDAVDFLAGDSGHKRRLSTNNTSLAWAKIRRPSFKHRLVDGLRWLKNNSLLLSKPKRAEPSPVIGGPEQPKPSNGSHS